MLQENHFDMPIKHRASGVSKHIRVKTQLPQETTSKEEDKRQHVITSTPFQISIARAKRQRSEHKQKDVVLRKRV